MKILLAAVGLSSIAWGQFYNISTIAGAGRISVNGQGNQAVGAFLVQPRGVAADSAGNVYFTDWFYQQVFQISPAGILSVYAGNGQPGFSGDNGPATSAQLFEPEGLAVDPAGNLYIADSGNSRVRKVTPGGTITTAVGNGQNAVTGDGGSAASAAVGGAYALALDGTGNLFIAETGFHVIRMVNPAGTIGTVAGAAGTPGYAGDGGPATQARFFNPSSLAVDKSGNVYVADTFNNRVRKFAPGGTITTVAGNGLLKSAGNGGAATSASLFQPNAVAMDAAGNLYIGENTSIVRVVNASGLIAQFAGGGGSLQNGPALQADLSVLTDMAVDNQGNLVLTVLFERQVRKVSPQQVITTLAGMPPAEGVGDNIPATSAFFLDPFGVAADNNGNVYVSDFLDNRVRKISSSGIITTVGGNSLYGYTGDGGPATGAELGGPRGISRDAAGNMLVASAAGGLLRRLSTAGTISTLVGGLGLGFSGDGGPASTAQLNGIYDAVADASGNIYISDANNARIRRIDPTGTISTFAGNGTQGFGGDGGDAKSAMVFQPRQLALDGAGNLYVADNGNNRIRRITPGGTISTVAGGGSGGALGDGGPATQANVVAPTGIALDTAGNLYIAASDRIRKVNASSGVITTIAGTGAAGFSGDGDLATLATFDLPQTLAVDGAGNLYFTDENNLRVRQLTPVQIVKEAVVNAASSKAGPVAPGELITIFGDPGAPIGPSTPAGLQLDSTGKVATQIGGTQVLFDGLAAPLIYVGATQINAVVPYEVAGETSTQLQLKIQGKPTNAVILPVAAASPGIFAITNQDGSANTSSNPVTAGGILVIYGTGEGLTTPTVPDGTINSTVLPAPNLPVTVQIGGQNAQVLYAGAGPGFVAGVLQVDVQVPAGVTGVVPLQMKIGTASTPAGVNVSVM
jgi:uncharacterized protein (TIGR03437 family)